MTVYSLGATGPQLPPEGEYWIAPNAAVMGNVIMRRNSSIWWGAIVRGDNDPIDIGENTNVQDGSVLHTDAGSPLTIGANVTIGHMVMLHGCTIGDGSLIGIGAVVVGVEVPDGRFVPHGAIVDSADAVERLFGQRGGGGICVSVGAGQRTVGRRERQGRHREGGEQHRRAGTTGRHDADVTDVSFVVIVTTRH